MSCSPPLLVLAPSFGVTLRVTVLLTTPRSAVVGGGGGAEVTGFLVGELVVAGLGGLVVAGLGGLVLAGLGGHVLAGPGLLELLCLGGVAWSPESESDELEELEEVILET